MIPSIPTPAVSAFPPTNWTLIARAAREGGEQSLAELCQTYWTPLYVFARRRGHPPEDARDLTQDFFLELIERGLLGRADAGSGRFRTFLLTCFCNTMGHTRERQSAAKRGGGTVTIPMAEENLERLYAAVAVDGMTPEALYDRAWARALLESVLERLRSDCGAGAGAERFAVGRSFLPRGGDTQSFAAAAARLGISVDAAKAYVHRLRRRYGEIFREEVQRTLPEGADLEEEIRHLYSAL